MGCWILGVTRNTAVLDGNDTANTATSRLWLGTTNPHELVEIMKAMSQFGCANGYQVADAVSLVTMVHRLL